MTAIEFDKWAQQFPAKCHKAIGSALKSEAYRLNQAVKQFALAGGEGNWRAFAPVTKALRKGPGYGKWWAKYTRYTIDDLNLRATIGMLTQDDVSGTARFAPISKSFAASAKRQAKGYAFEVNLERQRAIAKQLYEKYATRGRWKKAGRSGAKYFVASEAWRAMVPSLGRHYTPARPVIDPVVAREKERTLRNIATLFKTKIEGGQWSRNWASEWGNA